MSTLYWLNKIVNVIFELVIFVKKVNAVFLSYLKKKYCCWNPKHCYKYEQIEPVVVLKHHMMLAKGRHYLIMDSEE